MHRSFICMTIHFSEGRWGGMWNYGLEGTDGPKSRSHKQTDCYKVLCGNRLRSFGRPDAEGHRGGWRTGAGTRLAFCRRRRQESLTVSAPKRMEPPHVGSYEGVRAVGVLTSGR